MAEWDRVHNGTPGSSKVERSLFHAACSRFFVSLCWVILHDSTVRHLVATEGIAMLSLSKSLGTCCKEKSPKSPNPESYTPRNTNLTKAYNM